MISESGGHMSSSSQGSTANYRHPSEGPRRSSSVATAIITAPLQTSVLWTASPSGLRLSHRALLCQPRPLTSHLSLLGDNWFAQSSREEARSQRRSVCTGSFGQWEESKLYFSSTCSNVLLSVHFFPPSPCWIWSDSFFSVMQQCASDCIAALPA